MHRCKAVEFEVFVAISLCRIFFSYESSDMCHFSTHSNLRTKPLTIATVINALELRGTSDSLLGIHFLHDLIRHAQVAQQAIQAVSVFVVDCQRPFWKLSFRQTPDEVVQVNFLSPPRS